MATSQEDLSKGFGDPERMRKVYDYRFADQIKAAAGSIMDNMAEGFERYSRLEFLNSLSISKGECGELKSQL